MNRRKQRITAIICFYIYFFKPKDIEEIIADFFKSFIEDQPDGDYLMFDELTKNMMIDAIASQTLIIDKINKHLKKGWIFQRLGLVEQAILFMAISELVYEIDEKPIIINEAIEIAKIYGDEESYKMINAILDQL
jgi:N utilization substance protein B